MSDDSIQARIQEIEKEQRKLSTSLSSLQTRTTIQQESIDDSVRRLHKLAEELPSLVERLNSFNENLQRIEKMAKDNRERTENLEKVAERNNMVSNSVKWLAASLVTMLFSVIGAIMVYAFTGQIPAS